VCVCVCAWQVPLRQLGSRCESFFVMVPYAGVCTPAKALRMLGWRPRSWLDRYYTRAGGSREALGSQQGDAARL
jgi:hypothetical protein